MRFMIFLTGLLVIAAGNPLADPDLRVGVLLVIAAGTPLADPEEKEATGDWSPDPCFPMCTTDSAMTSPDPSRHCVKTDCFDEALCRDMCHVMMECSSYEWILNNDDNDIFGETWCAVDGLGMCYCCDC